MWCLWSLLAVLRILWCLLPQTGYIHPDEFFQSVEVIAGDLFNFDVVKTWEFNSSAPLRSMAAPYAIYGLPLYLLKTATGHFGIEEWIKPYTLLMLPRIAISILTVLCDFMILSMARKLNRDATSCVLTFASSYLTFVMYTRTLSNTLETILFAYLLYQVVKQLDGEESHSLSGSPFLISLTLVVGFFNRPTFPAFAFMPVLVWLYGNQKENSSIQILTALHKLFSIIFYGIFISIAFILADSVYYGTMSAEQLFDMDTFPKQLLLFKQWTITPLNFVLYNINSNNVAEHGLHPRTTHLMANAPMNFGVLGILALVTLLRFAVASASGHVSIDTKDTNDKFLLSCYFVPMLLLSVIPHQEARFIIPLLIPLVLQFGPKIFGSQSTWLLKIAWIVFNLIGCLFYGVMHQGGLIPCLTHLQSYIKMKPTIDHQIIFYHTYMPPRHLLMIPKPNNVSEKSSQFGGVTIHDFMGAPANLLQRQILLLDAAYSSNKNLDILVVLPASLSADINGIDKTLLKKFPLHLSMEDPPDMFNEVLCMQKVINNRTYCMEQNIFTRLHSSFSLEMYKIKRRFNINVPINK